MPMATTASTTVRPHEAERFSGLFSSGSESSPPAKRRLFIDHRRERERVGLVIGPGDRDVDARHTSLRGIGGDEPLTAKPGAWAITPTAAGAKLSAEFL